MRLEFDTLEEAFSYLDAHPEVQEAACFGCIPEYPDVDKTKYGACLFIRQIDAELAEDKANPFGWHKKTTVRCGN